VSGWYCNRPSEVPTHPSGTAVGLSDSSQIDSPESMPSAFDLGGALALAWI
jgi:hypothetical protein